ncbi:MAG: DoxX family protein [Saprospiraceae bacterium]
MTIINLVIIIAIISIVVTGLHHVSRNKISSYFITFLQYFTGILFLFSGWVKAVDPLGTAFKLQDYFAEFYTTFDGTALSFIAPIFPILSEYSIAFSIFMIIFEMVLGIMLILGDRPKLTSWLFFLLVVFFTMLTGFTYLTGYVPGDQNFFNFSAWGPYKISNMRVTDCGCFGDFILLEPKISFFKDLFLLIPAFYFIFKSKLMHQWLDQSKRNTIIWLSTILLIFYCVYNFYWNEPHVDFRPFKNGTNVATQKAKEVEASNAVQILEVVLKNKADGALQTIPFNQYMSNFRDYEGKYEVVEQIKSQPAMTLTKIFDFQISDFDGNDVTDTYLTQPEPQFMIVVYKPKYKVNPEKVTVRDSIFAYDTVMVVGFRDSIQIVKNFKEVTTKEVDSFKIEWDKDFLSSMMDVVKPLQEKASKANITTSIVTSGLDSATAQDLLTASGISAAIYTADEKLLKTIMRSNPGVVLWQNGVLVQKWHYKKLPSFDNIKSTYLK